ncbi:SMI1/KNR4 family protein [Planctopirus hydrillae]|nr:SMI1/KNR4 family protein [Planctopirus hydrillae]
MSIYALKLLVPPPDKPKGLRKNRRWDLAEAKLHTPLPTDYKEFIEAYGSGLFASFIRILNPFDRDEDVSLIRCSKTIVNIFREMKPNLGGKDFPFQLFPDQGGLLPCGTDDNGNFLFWKTEDNPEAWKIVVADGRGPRWQLFDMGLTDFLANALTKKIRCKIWPSDYPGNRKSFTFECF